MAQYFVLKRNVESHFLKVGCRYLSDAEGILGERRRQCSVDKEEDARRRHGFFLFRCDFP